MINSEMIENPVLEEIEDSAETLDERSGREGDRDRSVQEVAAEGERVEKDPLRRNRLRRYFQEYLDPGFRTSASNFEDFDKPSFEHFLSRPGTLTDHLLWQLGSMSLGLELRGAAELVDGQSERGGLPDGDRRGADGVAVGGRSRRWQSWPAPRRLRTKARALVMQLDPVGVGARDLRECLLLQIEVTAPRGHPDAAAPHQSRRRSRQRCRERRCRTSASSPRQP